MKLACTIIGICCFCLNLINGQTVTLDSSNLPIVIINTNGQVIANEPKITASMKVIYNGVGKINKVNTSSYHYDNDVAIEIRGNSSQFYPQKQYGFETKDRATKEDLNVSLCGLPLEEDWILYAPYNDISLMRNAMTYHLWEQMGHYAPRVKFCEVILNNDYQGIYILTEKIKQGPDRVDIAKMKSTDTSGLELTGGYIMKIDKRNAPTDKSFISKVKSTNNQNISWLFHYPSSEDIHPKQQAYIQNFIDSVEQTIFSNNFADPINGYRKFLSVNSFIDYFLLTELSRNIDAYKASSYFYKEKKDSLGGKGQFKAGPVWDYNFAFGNANFCTGGVTTGWMYDGCTPATLPTPIMWRKLIQDTRYINDVKCRYNEFRKTILDTVNLFNYLDSYFLDTLKSAQKRHFDRWKILGTNPGGFNAYVVGTYNDEIRRVKNWLRGRLSWMDANLGGVCMTDLSEPGLAEKNISVYPNPFNDIFTIVFVQEFSKANLMVSNADGKAILQKIISDNTSSIELNLNSYPPGIYFLKFQNEKESVIKTLVKI